MIVFNIFTYVTGGCINIAQAARYVNRCTLFTAKACRRGSGRYFLSLSVGEGSWENGWTQSRGCIPETLVRIQMSIELLCCHQLAKLSLSLAGRAVGLRADGVYQRLQEGYRCPRAFLLSHQLAFACIICYYRKTATGIIMHVFMVAGVVGYFRF